MNKEKVIKEKEWQILHTIVHPLRYKIIQILKKNPTHTGDLEKKLNTPRTTISYHVSILLQFGVLSPEFKVVQERNSPSAKMVKIYHVNADQYEKYYKIGQMLFSDEVE